MTPGEHVFARAGYSVVWWDPGALALGAEPRFGVRRDDLIVKDVARTVVADGRGRYDRWHLARIDARDAGSVPSVTVETVHEWTASPDRRGQAETVGPAQVQILEIAATRRPDAERVGGAAFGVLVHVILGVAPFDATAQDLQEMASAQAQMLGLTEEQAAAAADVAARVLAHELLARARRAAGRGTCRRETPITTTLADGTLIEGVVDLAFEENGAWTVVDYKTDREIAASGEERYRHQVALYASAIAQATGAPASGILVRI
jgi:ATP-dependent exoDNAse (exonuclease V) beta subunit